MTKNSKFDSKVNMKKTASNSITSWWWEEHLIFRASAVIPIDKWSFENLTILRMLKIGQITKYGWFITRKTSWQYIYSNKNYVVQIKKRIKYIDWVIIMLSCRSNQWNFLKFVKDKTGKTTFFLNKNKKTLWLCPLCDRIYIGTRKAN